MPEEQRRAISDRQKGKPFPPKAIENARKAVKGKPMSQEHRKAISEASKGKPGTRNGAKHTEEAKAKISASNRGKHSVPMPETAKAKLSAYWAGKPWPEARRAAYEKSRLAG